jgi:hypothetical protein
MLTLCANNLPETEKRQLEKTARAAQTSCAPHQLAKRFAAVEKLAKSNQDFEKHFLSRSAKRN